MTNYPYKNAYGSVVYEVKELRFRYKGIHAATIELSDVPGEKYHYHYEIESNEKWPELPSEWKKKGSNSIDSEKEAIQDAITSIEETLEPYFVGRTIGE